jgi:pentatricopeptide repeat protein
VSGTGKDESIGSASPGVYFTPAMATSVGSSYKPSTREPRPAYVGEQALSRTEWKDMSPQKLEELWISGRIVAGHSSQLCTHVVTRDRAQFDRIVAYFEVVRKHKIPVTSIFYNALFGVLKENGEMALALEVMKYMISQGVQPSPYNWNLLLGCCPTWEQAEHVLQVMDQLKVSLRLEDHNMLLKIVLKLKPEQLPAVLERRRLAGFPLDAFAYTILIHRAATLDEATLLYLEVLKLPVTAPELSLPMCSYISRLASAGRLASADKVLEMIRSLGLTPKERCFNTLINACGSRQPKRAIAYFEMLKEYDLPISFLHYSSLSQALRHSPEAEYLPSAYKLMQAWKLRYGPGVTSRSKSLSASSTVSPEVQRDDEASRHRPQTLEEYAYQTPKRVNPR